MADAPAIVRSQREQWLARRREMVTASDAAAILGIDPRRSALSVYAEKIGVLETPEKSWMRWGRRLEGVIADAYAEETGRPTRDLGAHVIQQHPDIAWLGATLDREIDGCERTPAPSAGPGVLEVKAVGGHKAKDWRTDPPVYYQIQAQIQMACTGWQWGALCALIGGQSLVPVDLLRNDRFLAAALPRLEEFLLRVQRRDPPPPDDSGASRAALKALYPKDDGETVRLEAGAIELADEWEGAKAELVAAKKKARGLENQLRALLGSATFGAMEDGSFISARVTANPGYTQVVKAYEYRSLRRFRPRLRRR